jgi:hypothetical protein
MNKPMIVNSAWAIDSRKAITKPLSGALFALCIGLFTATQAFADWPFGFGGDGNEEIWDIKTDPQGAIVVVGTFTGTLRIEDQGGGPEQVLLSAGLKDIYVIKYAASGNLLWARKAGGAADDTPHTTAID